MHIVFFGKPGAGKGTQAKRISEVKKIPHISTGDLLRSQVSQKTKIGIEIADIINEGGFASDEIMSELIRETISLSKDSFILDGFPRNLVQINYLESILTDLSISDIIYIYLEINDDVIFQRLKNRENCTNCNLIINISKLDGKLICPKCSQLNSFSKRNDDKIEVIKKRLNTFYNTTEPVIEYYSKKNKLITLDASLVEKELTTVILEIIK
jgi:adenylate kinase